MPDLSGYRFTPTHEWVHREGDTATWGSPIMPRPSSAT